jgi:hypothetical protein
MSDDEEKFQELCASLGVEPEPVADLRELYERTRPLQDGWIFRAAKMGEGLTTTLERAVLGQHPDLSRAFEVEARLLREFQRRAHHYVDRLPRDDDVLQWLALIRHYGGPTRLMDWTYSVFVALFFALSHKAEPGGGYVIWALDSDGFRRTANRLLGETRDIDLLGQGRESHASRYGPVFAPEGVDPLDLAPLVYPVNPFRLNERLSLQQGVFLCPRQLQWPFLENLKAMDPSKDILKAFTIPEESRRPLLRELDRMNMSSATLFPGLQGFAESLWTKPACYAEDPPPSDDLA